jgi:hypothetical protein
MILSYRPLWYILFKCFYLNFFLFFIQAHLYLFLGKLYFCWFLIILEIYFYLLVVTHYLCLLNISIFILNVKTSNCISTDVHCLIPNSAELIRTVASTIISVMLPSCIKESWNLSLTWSLWTARNLSLLLFLDHFSTRSISIIIQSRLSYFINYLCNWKQFWCQLRGCR